MSRMKQAYSNGWIGRVALFAACPLFAIACGGSPTGTSGQRGVAPARASGGTEMSAPAAHESAVQMESRGDFAKAESLFGAACKGGDLRACVRQAGYHVLGLGALSRDEERAASILRGACAAGGWLACAYEVMLCPGEPGSCRASAIESFEPSKWETIAQLCQDGAQDACTLHGMKLFMEEKLDTAAATFSRACAAGELDGCFLAVIATGLSKGRARDLPEFKLLLGPACEKGDGEACAAMATMVGSEDLKSLTRNPELESFLERSCAAQPSAYYIGSVGAPQRPMIAGSCAALSMLLEAHPGPQEAERARTLSLRACRLGATSFCPPDIRR